MMFGFFSFLVKGDVCELENEDIQFGEIEKYCDVIGGIVFCLVFN